MIEGYRIRAMEPKDLQRLHEIREAAYKPVFQSFRNIVGEKIAAIAIADAEQEQTDLLNRICQTGSSHEVFVVEYEIAVVAFCAMTLNQDSKVREIDLNAVHPEFQGKGIGTSMYRFALDRMREAGMSVATVGTGGDPSHAPARRAYEKVGFGPAIPASICTGRCDPDKAGVLL